MKLYELTNAINQVWDLVNNDEMDLEVLEDTLQSLEEEIEKKAEGIAHIMRQLDSEADYIKAEEKRLKERRDAVENRKDRLKKYLEEQLTLSGMDKVKTATVTVALQNNPPSVFIENENFVPEQFVTVETIRKVDKKSLLQALKDGEMFDGISLKQGRSLRIR